MLRRMATGLYPEINFTVLVCRGRSYTAPAELTVWPEPKG
jgi:hypothetical protein